MTVYGLYVLYLMLRRPEDLAVEENHVSWAHMYRMMFVAQIGFALAYLLCRRVRRSPAGAMSASANSGRVKRLRQPPERPGQPDALEDRVRFVNRRAAEIRLEAGAVPLLRQLPRLRDRHQRAARDASIRAPAIDVLFRPEEQDVRSGVGDVVPEVRGRDEQVDDAVAVGAAVLDAARNRLARPRAGGVDPHIAIERGRDAERVPGARRVPRRSARAHAKRASAPARTAAPTRPRRCPAAAR